MRRVNQLITIIRRQSENEDVSSTQGISDDEFIQYLCDAQRRLQSLFITRVRSLGMFDTTYSQNLVARQRAYAMPSDVFFRDTVRKVECSDQNIIPVTSTSSSTVVTSTPGSGAGYWPDGYWADGYWADGYWTETTSGGSSSTTITTTTIYSYLDPDLFWPLDKAFIQELSGSTNSAGWPEFYDIRNGSILVDPVPQSNIGALRVTYPRRLDTLDKRRGTVTGTPGTNGTDYTSLTVDTSTADLDAIVADDYLCVNDRDGNVTYYNIPYSSIDTGTGDITFEPGVSLNAGTITAGNYITLGRYSTTHSKLPDECENYLIAYAQWKILKRDSSADSQEQLGELTAMEDELIKAVTRFSRDIQYTPYINCERF